MSKWIFFNYGKTGLSNFLQNLKILIEGSNDQEERLKHIRYLGSLVKLRRKKNIENIEIDNLIFNILEDALITDENYLMRAESAEILIKYYLRKGLSSLIWAIQHDKSGWVLKKIYDRLIKIDNDNAEILKKEILVRFKKLEEKYDINPFEALFILDLEIELGADFFDEWKTNYIDDVKHGTAFFGVRDKHIIALKLWDFSLRRIPETISLLSKLKYLNLNSNPFTYLPDSIGKLTKLKTFLIEKNVIKKLPDFWENLTSLKKLSLEQSSELKSIPKSLLKLINKNFILKYIIEGLSPNEAPVLGLLEILLGTKIKNIDNYSETDYNIEPYYKINEQGHIIEISNCMSRHRLSIFPKQICYLKYLKEINFCNNEIKYIPDEIGNLKNLESLNLAMNIIKNVPESMSFLTSLNNLAVDEEIALKVPKSLKSILIK